MSFDRSLVENLAEIVGGANCISDAAAMQPYLNEDRGIYHNRAALVVRPADTAQIARVVSLCAEARVPIVPQGGNTGLCGGGVPYHDDAEVLLSLSRLNRIRELDPVNYTITAEAGCILADVQRVADDEGALFPLSLGAEGSCQIGGNLSTNAGGINVLRYGNARDLVLGLEVVLPDGRVWNGLRALRKDNTGYALRHLFVGAEGTLGIITAAVLKLFPKPLERATALCALADVASAMALLNRARSASGDAVTAFELMPRLGIEMCVRHIPGTRDPFDQTYPWYVLIEFSSPRQDAQIGASFEELLETSFAEGIIFDAAIAQNGDQAMAFWRIRESMPEAKKYEGASITHDVSVPVSRVPEFIERGIAAIETRFPGARPTPFGHLGDGNIHFSVSQPEGADKAAYLQHRGAMNELIHDLVVSMGGSISAEHGIGQLIVEELHHYKDPVELDLMRRVKTAIDPQNLMNPGKILFARDA